MRRSVLFAGVLGAVAAAAWGPSGLRAQSAGTMTVDFRVVGPDGQPVRDLKADEVTIRIAGRERSIQSLELVEVGGGGGGGGAAPAAGVPPPFGTNAGGGGGSAGRIVMIVVEDESLPPGAEVPLRQALGGFLDQLGPGDQVGLAIAPRDTAGTSFGAGVPKIKGALESLSGRLRNVSSSERACRSRDTLLMLRNLLSSFAGNDRPMTLLFFSTQLVTSSSGSCDLTTEMYQNLGTAAAAARAQVYVIDSDNAVSQRNEGLETLASVTGAGVVHRMAGNPDLLQRVAAETSAYYKATVPSESSDRAGQSQRFDLRLSRSDLTVRYRPEIVFTDTPAAGAKPAAKVEPVEMLRNTGAYTALPVRTLGVPSRDANGRIKVAVFSEPVDPSTKLSGAAIGLIGASGKFAPAVLDAKQLGAYPIVSAHSVEPGTYRLRFAAVAADGRAGAADYQVNATLTEAGSLKMSGLMIAALRNNAMAPQLVFTTEEQAVAYVEIYGELTGQVSARIEVAESVDGAAIETIQAGGQQTNEPDKFVLTGAIPMAKFTPGDYVVRAFVKMGDGAEGRVMASFRKAAK